MINKLDIIFTVPQTTAIDGAYADIETNFPFAQNLTEKEKLDNPTIDDAREPYVKRTVEIHAVNNPALVSGFAGTLVNAQNDWTVYNQFEGFIQKHLQLLEKMKETQDVAGAELYQFMREVYRMAKAAAANNVPGAQAVVDDLATLFEGQGPQPKPIIP
jgi:hypothetical protein